MSLFDGSGGGGSVAGSGATSVFSICSYGSILAVARWTHKGVVSNSLRCEDSEALTPSRD